MNRLRSSIAGFTLLETLVVLFILSLVMTLLMQGLSSIYRIRTSLATNILTSRPDTLRQHWLHDALSGMTADGSTNAHKFSGNASAISGLTFSPIFGKTGTPTAIELTIKQNKEKQCTLIYKEQGQKPLTLGEWRQAKCHFSYLNKNTKKGGDFQAPWHYDKKHLLQLPSAILFTVTSSDKESICTILSNIRGRRQDRIFFTELLN